MANLCKWLVRWARNLAPTSSAPSGIDDPSSEIGVEAAFSPINPADLKKDSASKALDTDWAIRRLNSRSNL
jgi:hypothetical protein